MIMSNKLSKNSRALQGYVMLEAQPCEEFYRRGDFIRCTAPVRFKQSNLWGMHLRYDHPFNGLLFVVALAFLATFVALTLLDTLEYQPDVDAIQQGLRQ